jgi:hypothetical protein
MENKEKVVEALFNRVGQLRMMLEKDEKVQQWDQE